MGIKIDKINDGLPISVVIPLQKKREQFFYEYTLPSIENNNPNEIIINDNNGLQGKKRNDGLDKATQKYLFYCDDDIILPANLLKNMLNILENEPNNIGYVYCGYTGIVLNPKGHPIGRNFNEGGVPFSSDRLMKGNFISPMSLFRKNILPKFDESLIRLEDWDLYLTLLDNGYYGKLMNGNFFAFYLDEGVTSKNDDERGQYINIIRKHNYGL